MVLPFTPKLTLFEFEKIICEPVFVEPTAPKTTLPWVDATVADAVIVEPFRPNVMLFELLKRSCCPSY